MFILYRISVEELSSQWPESVSFVTFYLML